MPIYEYECNACHHRLDVMQKISDPVLTQCPSCKKKKLVKLVSAPSFQLKGTGWYATDFKDKHKKVVESAAGDEKKETAAEKSVEKDKTNDSTSDKAE